MPENLNTLFHKNQEFHSHNTRGSKNLRTPKIYSKLAEKFITFSGAKIWNDMQGKLDANLKISTFKQHLISLLLKNYKD